MTLNQLRAFLVAARLGSFTAAADELQMAQPSISELVRRMEQEYGVPFFVRGGRRLVLTSAGQELLPFAERSVGAADNADRALRALRSLGGGLATFGVLRNAEYYRLADLVQEFHARYPAVRVQLHGQNSVAVAAAVSAGNLEAGLVVLPIDDEGLSVRPLLRDEVLYASSDPSQVAEPITIHQLAEARLVLYDTYYGWSDPTRRQLADRALREGLKIEPQVEVEHVDTALSLVARGVGDTIVSRAVAASPTCPPGVHTVSFVEPLYDTVALIKRETTTLSPATQEIARLATHMLLAHQDASVEIVGDASWLDADESALEGW
jgi:DNA-binding transcriptional LysR family regulator